MGWLLIWGDEQIRGEGSFPQPWSLLLSSPCSLLSVVPRPALGAFRVISSLAENFTYLILVCFSRIFLSYVIECQIKIVSVVGFLSKSCPSLKREMSYSGNVGVTWELFECCGKFPPIFQSGFWSSKGPFRVRYPWDWGYCSPIAWMPQSQITSDRSWLCQHQQFGRWKITYHYVIYR